MNVDIHGAPIYFEIPILGGIKITASLVVTWGVMLVLTLVCIFLTHGMKVNNISKRQAIAEKIVLTAENFVRSNMGEAWMEWTPFISAIFALSIFSSLASLIGLWSPTADVSTTLAWALVVFVIMTYFKLKTNGLGGYLKGFCDPTRVQILSLLAEREMCVTDIAEATQVTQSAISHQLRLLKQMQLIKFRREGKNILYSLADDHVYTILQMGMEHILE